MDDNRLFTDKYRPRNLGEVVSNNLAISKLRSFVQSGNGKKALMLYGPSGTGKSCSVYALAEELGYEVVEINASDYRNKENIIGIVRNAAIQRSLFDVEKIIIIDEVDGLAGNEDRGGVQEVIRVIDDANAIIILITNDPWIDKLNALRQKCELAEFNKIDYLSILKLLKKICECENIKAREEDLIALARKVDGDLRAAINDLQALIEHGVIEVDDVGKRERKENIFAILKSILADKDLKKMFYLMDNNDIEPDELFLWLDENLPESYKHKDDLARAYDMLSRADVYRGRIRRQQYWRLLAYVSSMLNIGISLSKKNSINPFVKYKRTTRLLKIWKAKAKNAKKIAMAGRFANATHTSIKRAVKDFDYIRQILKDKTIASELGLNKEEIAAL